jgi:hypothetical protein
VVAGGGGGGFCPGCPQFGGFPPGFFELGGHAVAPAIPRLAIVEMTAINNNHVVFFISQPPSTVGIASPRSSEP